MADRLAQFHTPVTVRFLVLQEAKGLAYLPPELAEVGDRPLARRDLSLVFKIAGSETMELEGAGERLRMPTVFSQPTDVSALAHVQINTVKIPPEGRDVHLKSYGFPIMENRRVSS